MKLPNSVMVAVDPKTLDVLDMYQLPETAASPHIIVPYDDKIAIYVPMMDTLARYFWDPATKKITADDTWVAHPLVDGQKALTAPTVIGDWIAVQTNGLLSKDKASSIVVYNKDDVTKTHSIFPMGDLGFEGLSWAPPKLGADPENNMLYSADMGMKRSQESRSTPPRAS